MDRIVDDLFKCSGIDKGEWLEDDILSMEVHKFISFIYGMRR